MAGRRCQAELRTRCGIKATNQKVGSSRPERACHDSAPSRRRTCRRCGACPGQRRAGANRRSPQCRSRRGHADRRIVFDLLPGSVQRRGAASRCGFFRHSRARGHGHHQGRRQIVGIRNALRGRRAASADRRFHECLESEISRRAAFGRAASQDGRHRNRCHSRSSTLPAAAISSTSSGPTRRNTPCLFNFTATSATSPRQ